MRKKIILIVSLVLVLGMTGSIVCATDAKNDVASNATTTVVKEEPIAISFDAKVYDPMGQMLVDNIKSAFKKDKNFTLTPRFGCPYLSIHISTMTVEGRDGKVCAYSEVVNFVPMPDPATGNEVYPWYIGGTVGVCTTSEIAGDSRAVYENVKTILGKHKDIALALHLPVVSAPPAGAATNTSSVAK